MICNSVKKYFYLQLKFNFLEGGGNGPTEGNDNPNHAPLTIDEIQQVRAIISYVLSNSGDSFNCSLFQRGGQFYIIRQRIADILGHRIGNGIDPDSWDFKYQRLGIQDYGLFNNIISFVNKAIPSVQKLQTERIVPTKQAKQVLEFLEMKRKKQESILINKLRKGSLETRLEHLRNNPDLISTNLIEGLLPEPETMRLINGGLSNELVKFLEGLLVVLSTWGEFQIFKRYLESLRFYFQGYEKVNNQIAAIFEILLSIESRWN